MSVGFATVVKRGSLVKRSTDIGFLKADIITLVWSRKRQIGRGVTIHVLVLKRIGTDVTVWCMDLHGEYTV